MPTLPIDGSTITLQDLESVARTGRPVRLADASIERMRGARVVVERFAASPEAIYGVNTGFGVFARERIGVEGLRDVQRNLVRSHACGVMEPLPADIVRATMLLLAASLARGHSGTRPMVAERLLDLLNAGITPLVPSRGSVGASGDLAPLAHIALVLIGEGTALVGDRAVPAMDALRGAGLEPVTLEAKEGLSLINGTHLMAAIGGLLHADLRRLIDASIAAAALAIDACRASAQPLDERLHRARGQQGQAEVARRLRADLEGSGIGPAHREGDPRVQDPYCLRAAPQVMGAACDLLAWSQAMTARELGAVTDNPLVFTAPGAGPDDAPGPGVAPPSATDAILSGGNFHGMPIAMALDVIPMALAALAGIAERRIYWVLAGHDPVNPVHPSLSPHPGLESGYMIAQYAAAACCNEIQTCCVAATAANIPTSAGVEDFNSFGPAAGFKAMRARELATQVIAIELLVMAEALEYQRPLRSGAGVERTYERVRSLVTRLDADRPPAPDIARLAAAIRAGHFGAPA